MNDALVEASAGKAVEPSVVKRTVPAAPTAVQDVVVAQATPFSAWVVPLVCASQVWPPFVVARIVPAFPTPKHVDSVGQETDSTPMRETARRMKGRTVVGRSLPPVRPQAVTVPP